MANKYKCCWACKYYYENEEKGYCKQQKVDVEYKDYCDNYIDAFAELVKKVIKRGSYEKT